MIRKVLRFVRPGLLLAVPMLLVLADRFEPAGLVVRAAPKRTVVFELFGSTCAACRSAGEAVDALAAQYEQAGLPVVFIEYRSSEYLGNRLDRWYEACPNWRACYLPLELVDSGWRWSCGPKDYLSAYTELVQQALANPASGELAASFTRAGNHLEVTVHLTNYSGVALGPENDATVNVIVVERTRVLNTARYARAAAALPIDVALLDGSAATYKLQLFDVPVTEWRKAVVVALVDYRPEAGAARYEALQAAVAEEVVPPTTTPSPSPTATGPTPTPTASPTRTPTPLWPATPAFLPLAVAGPPHRSDG